MVRMFRVIKTKSRQTSKKKVENQSSTNWTQIFDLFTNEYGWDTEKVLSITMKELFWRLDAIYARQSSRNTFEAGLHGVKLKESSIQSGEEIEVTQIQQDKINAQLKSRMSNGRD